MASNQSSLLIVQKFGGSSVATLDRIKRVASIIQKTVQAGHQVIAVVSAMGGETDRLTSLATELNVKSGVELDTLLASGEQASAALLAMALQQIEVPAASFCGHQVAIHTTAEAQQARIESIDSDYLLAALKDNTTPVVAGFQGTDSDGRITTLGRGGSDLTAVALAAALDADECQIYSDTDGVYTADPRLVPGARRLDTITLPLMTEYAKAGAKILQSRCLALATQESVPLRILSSYHAGEGTRIEPAQALERAGATGITSQPGYQLLQIQRLPPRPGLLSYSLAALAQLGISPDMAQFSADRLIFAVKDRKLANHMPELEAFAADLSPDSLYQFRSGLTKLTLVGAGMGSGSPVFSDVFRLLSQEGVDPCLLSASSTRIEVLLTAEEATRVITPLHDSLMGK